MSVDTDIAQQNTDLIAELQDSSVSWAVSLCFWSTLLLAAAVYCSVALSPKFAVWNKVRNEYQNNIRQLVTLETEVSYLERVETALKTDPEFVQRLAGVSKPNKADGEELIPVSGSLLFGQSDEVMALEIAPTELPFYHGMILRLASDTKLRTILLCFSAGLTIFAFTFLNDAGHGFVYSTGSLAKRMVMLPMHRYFSAAPAIAPEIVQDAATQPNEADSV